MSLHYIQQQFIAIRGFGETVLPVSGGIWFLHEEKSKREMTYIVIGLIFIIGGSILTGLPSKIRKEGS